MAIIQRQAISSRCQIVMRVVMIHAIAESIPPVITAFGEVFPETELVNLLDEGLFLDFDDHITPALGGV